MAEIDIQTGIFRGSVTLTLTSDDLKRHIVVKNKSTSTNITNRFVAALRFIVNVTTYTYLRTEGWTDIFTHFIRSSSQQAKII